MLFVINFHCVDKNIFGKILKSSYIEFAAYFTNNLPFLMQNMEQLSLRNRLQKFFGLE